MIFLLKKILKLVFKILLILFAVYLLRLIFQYFSLNFSTQDIFYYIIVGFALWVIAEWMKG